MGLLSESILSLLLWVANYTDSFAGGNRQQYSPHHLQAGVKHDIYVYFNPSFKKNPEIYHDIHPELKHPPTHLHTSRSHSALLLTLQVTAGVITPSLALSGLADPQLRPLQSPSPSHLSCWTPTELTLIFASGTAE